MRPASATISLYFAVAAVLRYGSLLTAIGTISWVQPAQIGFRVARFSSERPVAETINEEHGTFAASLRTIEYLVGDV
ncbi:hypothetical protein [Bradyrhizobium sp. DASA03007]|uniref:hypothetical protein n=1 Tax=unclassified Bradyrhizobium TaxID=2631580 RepID=UPI003F71CECA